MDEWVPVIKNTNKGIVRIVLYCEGEIVSEGTGTIISATGIVLTAWHVVETCNYYVKKKRIILCLFLQLKGDSYINCALLSFLSGCL